ncbi:AraC family transcriptional regulator, partial [Salegentibacter sp. JZCK2]|nr:AraC family transcriptional regulator [Salegentibacter tibetensis]
FAGETNERLIISDISSTNQNLITDFQANDLTLLWFTGNGNYLTIDSVPYEFHKNQIICLTEFHKIEITAINAAQMIRFNRSFYCI